MNWGFLLSLTIDCFFRFSRKELGRNFNQSIPFNAKSQVVASFSDAKSAPNSGQFIYKGGGIYQK